MDTNTNSAASPLHVEFMCGDKVLKPSERIHLNHIKLYNRYELIVDEVTLKDTGNDSNIYKELFLVLSQHLSKKDFISFHLELNISDYKFDIFSSEDRIHLHMAPLPSLNKKGPLSRNELAKIQDRDYKAF